MSTSSASFSLKNYRFPQIHLNLSHLVDEREIVDVSISIIPQGIYKQSIQEYLLKVHCQLLLQGDRDSPMVDVHCEAVFGFNEDLSIGQIPDYFYPNSVAIIFPYVRAMISTLSLQANTIPVILPTMNLTNLQEELKRNTKEE